MTSVLVGATAATFTTVTSAEVYAQQLLDNHTGAGEVAVVAVGSDSYLFYVSAGTDNAPIDSIIKLDAIAPGSMVTSDFIV